VASSSRSRLCPAVTNKALPLPPDSVRENSTVSIAEKARSLGRDGVSCLLETDLAAPVVTLGVFQPQRWAIPEHRVALKPEIDLGRLLSLLNQVLLWPQISGTSGLECLGFAAASFAGNRVTRIPQQMNKKSTRTLNTDISQTNEATEDAES
jgi:hypothetical protein